MYYIVAQVIGFIGAGLLIFSYQCMLIRSVP